jgi:predicted RNase H-like nuclease (RuvC/YqgF family)
MIVKIVMPTEGGIELGSGGATAARFRQHVHDAVQTTSTKKKKVVAKGIPVVKGTPVPESS